LDRRLGELLSRSGLGGEEKDSQPLSGLEPPIIGTVKSFRRQVFVSMMYSCPVDSSGLSIRDDEPSGLSQ